MNSLTNYLVSLGPWNWLILGVALFILETIVPGVHFVWFGLAASLVGVLALTVGMTWEWQLITFGVVALLTVFVVRYFAGSRGSVSEQPDLNVRGQYYVGRIVIVDQAIVAGRGRVRVGDTHWAAQGPDMDVGAEAKVVGVNGTVLVVEAL